MRGISNRAAANAYAPEFIAAYNQRFAREPRNAHDAHRPVDARVDIERVFTWQEKRRLSGSLTLHYKRAMYIVDPDCEAAKSARGKRVLVRENQAGEVMWAQASATGELGPALARYEEPARYQP